MPPDWSAAMPPAPTGNSSVIAQQYYHWLYANYFASIPAERIFDLWSGPVYIFGFLFVLALSFYLYSRIAQAHRTHGELYGVESFGGVILERIGPVDMFTFVISVMLILWTLYFLITQALYGAVY